MDKIIVSPQSIAHPCECGCRRTKKKVVLTESEYNVLAAYISQLETENKKLKSELCDEAYEMD